MTESIPIIEARNKLTTLSERFVAEPELGAIAVTRRGKPVLALMPWDLYESIIETLEVMSDPDLLPTLKKSIKEAQAGKVIDWEKAKKGLAK